MLTDLCEQLKKIKDDDGTLLINRILKREEVYFGPRTNEAPEIILEPQEGYIFNQDLNSDPFEECSEQKFYTGTHDKDGIFILSGDKVKINWSDKCSFLDMVPMIFYLLGVEIPTYFDGSVPNNLFIEGIEKAKYRDSSFEGFNENLASLKDKKTMKRLKDLGYL